MEDVIFVDSNVWCYYFDAETREHAQVAKVLEKCFTRRICINAVVLLEVAHYLVKRIGSPGKELAERLASAAFVLPIDVGITREAIALLAKHSATGIGGRDASVLASMKAEGISTIMTHDRSFRKISGVRVIDPVKRTAAGTSP